MAPVTMRDGFADFGSLSAVPIQEDVANILFAIAAALRPS
jgi:hypothetical protein